MMRVTTAAVALAALLIIAVACGDGDKAPATGDRTAAPALSPLATRPPVAGAPEGYASSCAAAMPWGQPLQAPFVCVDIKRNVMEVTGNSLPVEGYAAGATNNQVTVELRDASGKVLTKTEATYEASAAGGIGRFETKLNVPANTNNGPVRIAASLTGPGGARAEAEGYTELIIVPRPRT